MPQQSLRLAADRFSARDLARTENSLQGALYCQGSPPAYRYALWRNWDLLSAPAKRVLWVCLNPSTATEFVSDPSIRRMIAFSKSWGFSGLFVANLFAYRSTDPWVLYDLADPVGPANDRVITDLAAVCFDVVCGWGKHGALASRGRVVADLLRGGGSRLWLLEKNKDGSPKHPLYIAAKCQRQEYLPERPGARREK